MLSMQNIRKHLKDRLDSIEAAKQRQLRLRQAEADRQFKLMDSLVASTTEMRVIWDQEEVGAQVWVYAKGGYWGEYESNILGVRLQVPGANPEIAKYELIDFAGKEGDDRHYVKPLVMTEADAISWMEEKLSHYVH